MTQLQKRGLIRLAVAALLLAAAGIGGAIARDWLVYCQSPNGTAAADSIRRDKLNGIIRLRYGLNVETEWPHLIGGRRCVA